MSSCEPTPPAVDADLVAAGWERRFMADPDRLEESTQIYLSLGLEVKAVPLGPLDFSNACGDCPETVCKTYMMIYTRKPPAV
ncbi:MAG: hypothetical protein HQ519_17550 [Planctomycetes bacterium]|nr:hypothetical protein [Planctomycetota bacterium]